MGRHAVVAAGGPLTAAVTTEVVSDDAMAACQQLCHRGPRLHRKPEPMYEHHEGRIRRAKLINRDACVIGRRDPSRFSALLLSDRRHVRRTTFSATQSAFRVHRLPPLPKAARGQSRSCGGGLVRIAQAASRPIPIHAANWNRDESRFMRSPLLLRNGVAAAQAPQLTRRRCKRRAALSRDAPGASRRVVHRRWPSAKSRYCCQSNSVTL